MVHPLVSVYIVIGIICGRSLCQLLHSTWLHSGFCYVCGIGHYLVMEFHGISIICHSPSLLFCGYFVVRHIVYHDGHYMALRLRDTHELF